MSNTRILRITVRLEIVVPLVEDNREEEEMPQILISEVRTAVQSRQSAWSRWYHERSTKIWWIQTVENNRQTIQRMLKD
ncbi:unnamed protein product [Rotaria magnacalcarata]|uniref:Uncharacterized protein n=1 Tax=Rotaria magnacalcarata TaxID=392030 RepID=A0A8S2YRL4_9BILA|nr:unnamed protein product [Rotaria magnacalcarata]